MVNWLAVADKSKNSISGAEIGSLTYYHEVAHLAYNDNPIYNRMSLAEEQFKTIGLIFIVLSVSFQNAYLTLGSLISILFSVGLGLYEEFYCWRVAWIKKKELTKN